MTDLDRVGEPLALDVGETRSFDLDLAAGDYLHATVEQHGIDVTLSLLGPAGEALVRIDSPVGAHGTEELVAIAGTAGVHRLRVEAPAEGGGPGEIVLRPPERRPAGAPERDLADADRAYREGRELLRSGDLGAAVERLEEALRVFRRRSWGSREALALDSLGRAYEESGSLLRAAEACEEAAELYLRHEHGHMVPHLLERAGWLCLQLGQAVPAADRLGRALNLLPDDTPARRRADLLIRLAAARRAAGEVALADDALARAVAEKGGAEEACRARVLSEHGRFQLGRGHEEAALELFAEAVEILRRHDEAPALIAALSGMAAASLQAGDPESGEAAITEALERIESTGDRRQRAVALNTLGNLRRRAGDLAAARSAYEEALELAEAVGDQATFAVVLLALGHLETLERAPQHGIGRIERARELFGRLGDEGRERIARVRAAQALRDLGRLGEAYERLEPVLDLLGDRRKVPAVAGESPRALLPLGLRPEHLGIAVDVLLRLDVLEPERGHRLRARELEEMSRRSGGSTRGPETSPRFEVRPRLHGSAEPPVEPKEPINPAHSDLPRGDEGAADPAVMAELEAVQSTRRARMEADKLDLSEPAAGRASAGGPAGEPEIELSEPPDLGPAELGRRLVASWRAAAPTALADQANLAREYEKSTEEEIRLREGRRELPASADPHDLAETGWGVIFSRDESPEVVLAMQPLLDRRREQAGGRFRELTHVPGETARRFLWLRHGEAPGVLDPAILPYYLLIVGGPEAIPFEFQYQLAINHAVGRVAFDDPSDYRRYVEAVLEAEDHGTDLPRRAAIFSVENEGDRTTSLLTRHLVAPLAQRLPGVADWEVEVWDGERSSKRDLQRLLGGDATPGLILVSCHGVKAQPGGPAQCERQGALLCSDWPGPGHRLSPEHALTGADLARAHPRLRGTIAVLFACYGAGTPFEDNFPHELPEGVVVGQPPPPRPLARESFVARLPQALLSHGALAVLGHVDRGWTTAFHWEYQEVSADAIRSLEDSLKQLLAGHRIGHALRPLARRYTAIASALADDIEQVRRGSKVDEEVVAFEWTAHNDARNLVLLGDPAVYLLGRRCWHGELAGSGPVEVRLAEDLAALVGAEARDAGISVQEWVDRALRRRVGAQARRI